MHEDRIGDLPVSNLYEQTVMHWVSWDVVLEGKSFERLQHHLRFMEGQVSRTVDVT